jgi:nitroreductase
LICIKSAPPPVGQHGSVDQSVADPWALNEADYPARGTREEQLRFALRYAILAPSNRNTQPWSFGVGADQITIHVELSRWQPVSDPYRRELYVSIGCALENLLIALEHFGFGHVVTRSPGALDDTIAVQVAVLDRPAPAPYRTAALFKAIVRRHTSHGRYRDRPLAPLALRRLAACNVEPQLSLLLTQNPRIKATANALMLRAEAIGFSDAAYRDELAKSIGDGNFGGAWLLTMAQQFAVAHLHVTTADVRGSARALTRSPVFGLISARTGNEDAQIRAGQLLERLYLAATWQGLSLQPVSQLLEVEKVRAQFAKLFRAGGIPLVAFRVGHPDSPAKPAPRRPLEEALQ